jgi:hypothetical protein
MDNCTTRRKKMKSTSKAWAAASAVVAVLLASVLLGPPAQAECICSCYYADTGGTGSPSFICSRDDNSCSGSAEFASCCSGCRKALDGLLNFSSMTPVTYEIGVKPLALLWLEITAPLSGSQAL